MSAVNISQKIKDKLLGEMLDEIRYAEIQLADWENAYQQLYCILYPERTMEEFSPDPGDTTDTSIINPINTSPEEPQ